MIDSHFKRFSYIPENSTKTLDFFGLSGREAMLDGPCVLSFDLKLMEKRDNEILCNNSNNILCIAVG